MNLKAGGILKDRVYAEAPIVRLEDYIPADRFRTVMEAQLDIPPGYSETRVVIEIGKDSPNRKLFPEIFGYSMFVFGYVRENQNIKDVFEGEMAKEYKNRKISLIDWNDKFLLLFENGTRTMERAFWVSVEDVKFLMEHCRHPNLRKV
ncbi:MAG: hypothetical protein PWQ76_325 [Clostridiales bacterium]|jgi:hypothetical protein|nr:hypothetical protein [Oscillospiraceae bacterium]MDN5378072.1 hypothetical protein [Clostridiales bacterium]